MALAGTRPNEILRASALSNLTEGFGGWLISIWIQKQEMSYFPF